MTPKSRSSGLTQKTSSVTAASLISPDLMGWWFRGDSVIAGRKARFWPPNLLEKTRCHTSAYVLACKSG